VALMIHARLRVAPRPESLIPRTLPAMNHPGFRI
jgi:hypothetical protein